MPGEAGGGTVGVRDPGRGGGARGVVVGVVGARGGRAGRRRLGLQAPLLPFLGGDTLTSGESAALGLLSWTQLSLSTVRP